MIYIINRNMNKEKMTNEKKQGRGGEYFDLYPAGGYDPTEWERACVTVDTCICRIHEGEFQVLLSKRQRQPFSGKWGLPGGFVDIAGGENLEQAAYRTLKQKTGLGNIPVRQLGTYGASDRDPRWRIITVVYFALVCEVVINQEIFRAMSEDPRELEHRWFSLHHLPETAFDHAAILVDLVERLREDIRRSPIAFELVPPEFTWAQLQRVYETILGKKLAAGNFRRDLLRLYEVEKLDRLENGLGRGKGRTGSLLRFVGERSSLN